MKLLLENWNRYLKEVEFHDSPDEDKPGKNQIIVFDPNEEYNIEGDTHGGLSHMIKHYMEFEPSKVASALKQAIEKAKGFDNFILRSVKSGQAVTGDEAKNAANENAMLNTFDMINDKLKNNQPLTNEEEQLKQFISPLNTEYQNLINSYMSSAADVENIQDAAAIKQVLDAGKIIKFIGAYKGKPVQYFFNPSNTGLVAYKDQKVATLFRIDKKGNDLSKAAKYFSRGVELKNPAFAKALASFGAPQATQQSQPQKKQRSAGQQKKKGPNPRAMAMGMSRGGKTPEEIQAQIKKSIGIDISVDNIKKMIGA